jgi:hypothetical protein
MLNMNTEIKSFEDIKQITENGDQRKEQIGLITITETNITNGQTPHHTIQIRF